MSGQLRRAGKPYHPLHDRRSTDLLAAGHYAVVDVQCPYNPEDKISVARQTRGDPLGRLHAHRQIDDAQYHAGREFQFDRETAERGARAIDPTKEAVDGGQLPEPLTDHQAKARKRLIRIEGQVGRRLYRVLEAVLIDGLTMEQISGSRAQAVLKFYGKLFRLGLEELVTIYGFSNERPQKAIAGTANHPLNGRLP